MGIYFTMNYLIEVSALIAQIVIQLANVIPAKAGIERVDPRMRGDDTASQYCLI